MYVQNNVYEKHISGKKTKNANRDYIHFFFLFGSLPVLHHICGMRENEKQKAETQRQIELCSAAYVISIFFSNSGGYNNVSLMRTQHASPF